MGWIFSKLSECIDQRIQAEQVDDELERSFSINRIYNHVRPIRHWIRGKSSQELEIKTIKSIIKFLTNESPATKRKIENIRLKCLILQRNEGD